MSSISPLPEEKSKTLVVNILQATVLEMRKKIGDSHVGCKCWARLKTGAEEYRHKLSDRIHGRGENVAQITENRMIENNLKSKPVKTVISTR